MKYSAYLFALLLMILSFAFESEINRKSYNICTCDRKIGSNYQLRQVCLDEKIDPVLDNWTQTVYFEKSTGKYYSKYIFKSDTNTYIVLKECVSGKMCLSKLQR